MIQKKEAFTKSFQLIKYFITSERQLVLKIIQGVLISNLFLVTIPFFIQFLVGHYLNLNLNSPVVLISLLIFILLSCAYLMVVLNYYFAELICRRIFINNFHKILSYLVKTDQPVHHDTQYSRFLEIVPSADNLVNLIYQLSHTVIVMFFGMLIIVSYHPYFLFYALTLLLLISIIFIFLFPHALALKSHLSDLKYRIAGKIMIFAKDNKSIKESPEKAEVYFRRMSASYLRTSSKYFQIIMIKNIFIAILIPIAQALFVYISAKLIFAGTLSLGQFVSAELVLTYILASIHNLIINLDKVISVIISFEKVHSIIETK